MVELWNNDWTPTHPLLDANGNLRTIIDLFGPGANGRPISLGTNGLSPQDDIDFHYSYSSMSLSVASTLTLGNYVDSSIAFDQRVHSFDFAVGIFESFDGPVIPADQIISATFWGMTVRVFLRVKALNADFDVEANLGPVAFASAVELGRATVEFQATGFCSDPRVFASVLEGVPITGKFDIRAYQRFSERLAVAQRDMLAFARSHPDRLLPIGVKLRAAIDDTSFMDEASSLRWALGRLRAKQRLSTALKDAPSHVDKDLVTELYRHKVTGDGTGVVGQAVADWAGEQLRLG